MTGVLDCTTCKCSIMYFYVSAHNFGNVGSWMRFVILLIIDDSADCCSMRRALALQHLHMTLLNTTSLNDSLDSFMKSCSRPYSYFWWVELSNDCLTVHDKLINRVPIHHTANDPRAISSISYLNYYCAQPIMSSSELYEWLLVTTSSLQCRSTVWYWYSRRLCHCSGASYFCISSLLWH